MINKLDKFSIVDSDIVNKLDCEAAGLYTKLCCIKDIKNFDFSIENVTKLTKKSQKKTREIVRQLVEFKIILRVAKKKGKNFNGWCWIINPTQEDLKNLKKDPFFINKSNKSTSKKTEKSTCKNDQKSSKNLKSNNNFFDFKNKIVSQNKSKKIAGNLQFAPTCDLFLNKKGYLEFRKDINIYKIGAAEAIEIWQFLFENQNFIYNDSNKIVVKNAEKKDDFEKIKGQIIITKTNNAIGGEEQIKYKIVDIIKSVNNKFQLSLCAIDNYNNILSEAQTTQPYSIEEINKLLQNNNLGVA